MSLLISVKQAAEELGVSDRTIQGWILNGTHLGPKFIKVGGLRKIRKSDILSYLSTQA